MGRLICSAGEIASARAIASGGEISTERCIERILALIGFKNALLYVSEEMEKIFSALGREERYLLEYKYFRRKSRLEGEFADIKMACSERTYFRRQARLAAKLNALFMREGLTEQWFARTLGEYPYIRQALEKLREAGEYSFTDKRARCSLAREGAKRGA